jgi:hypothetical protein
VESQLSLEDFICWDTCNMPSEQAQKARGYTKHAFFFDKLLDFNQCLLCMRAELVSDDRRHSNRFHGASEIVISRLSPSKAIFYDIWTKVRWIEEWFLIQGAD